MQKLLQPGEIEATASAIPELRLPTADLFARRAKRLRQLARGHSLADYLDFVAAIAEAQDAELRRIPEAPLPDAAYFEHCRAHGFPPLGPIGFKRDDLWRQVLSNLIDAVHDQAPVVTRTVFARLRAADTPWLDVEADRLLACEFARLDLAAAPLIGAAVQVAWTDLARRLDPTRLEHTQGAKLCPVCGSHPVASVIRIGGEENGLRYLSCTLCGSEWHEVRAKCSHCGNARDLAYYSIEGHNGAVRAEHCPACDSYLKVINLEKDPEAEPLADDLASLALDLLMENKAAGRSGVNYFMLPGEAEAVA